VTGANGFLGKHLLRALSHLPVPVRALYRQHKPDPDPDIEWLPCDLLNTASLSDAFKDVKQVYHCAATVSFDPRRQKETIEQNITITANVVNAALDEGVQKLIHVSSIAALGRGRAVDDNAAPFLIDEEEHWEESKNNSQYAQGKYLSELEVWRGIAEGLHAAIVNPAVILGEGDWTRGAPKLMQIVYDEFPWFTSGINAWVDVEDVVKAMVLLMDSEISGERFILSSGNYAYKEVFTKMANALNRRPPHKLATKWMTALVWRIELLKSRLANKEATITRETARNAQSQYFYQNEKFLRAFPGFQYHKLDETIDRMAQAFLNKA
jgi:nucleoside-diphosphate-sugar epimerase